MDGRWMGEWMMDGWMLVALRSLNLMEGRPRAPPLNVLCRGLGLICCKALGLSVQGAFTLNIIGFFKRAI